MTRLRQRMLDDLRRRNYSPDTIRGYIRAVQEFAEYFGRSPEQLGAAELWRYQLHLLHERRLALGTVENNITALQFLYKKTLKRRDLAFDDLPFPKQPHTLPTVLSQDEVTRLIEAAPNRVHRMLLILLYATGMHRTEASLLKVSDIDSQRMVIRIRRGKGLRDRDVPLTSKLLEALREYWRWKKPRVYLFPSKMSDPGVEQPISDKTVSRETLWSPSPFRDMRAALIAFTAPTAFSLDTGNLDQRANWVASHAQIVLHSNLSCMFDFLVASTESQRP